LSADSPVFNVWLVTIPQDPNQKPDLPTRDSEGPTDIFTSIGRFFTRKVWVQVTLGLVLIIIFLLLFRHHLPDFRLLTEGLRPEPKELFFESSDEMIFTDPTTNKKQIWYDIRDDGYHFFDNFGYFEDREYQLADTPGEIKILKEWVDQQAIKARESEARNRLNQTSEKLNERDQELQQLKERINTLEEDNQSLKESNERETELLANANKDIDERENRIKQLEDQVKNLQAALATKIASSNSGNSEASSDSNPSPIHVSKSIDPEVFQAGVIVPPNPKPRAWFESLRWGYWPGKPYTINHQHLFFELKDKPETRIAPHPHFIGERDDTKEIDRPFTRFIVIHTPFPKDLKIAPLSDHYYQMIKRRYGKAQFDSEFPYTVTVNGVRY
jgi:archaellum component FlaC